MVKQVLNLEQLPSPDHASDALAAAICFATHALDGRTLYKESSRQ
jgi:crossover junction endodeoxyribonuclease RuvC